MEDTEEDLPKWYDQFQENATTSDSVSNDELFALRIEAQHVLEEETKIYNSKQSKGKKSSDTNWIKTVLTKGTAGDRVAALVVTAQNSPIHNLSAITSLVSMVKVGKKKQCTSVMETLSELFLEDLMKPGVKLKPFEAQQLGALNELSGGNAMTRRLRLAAWMFEDKLKQLFNQFISALDLISKDTVEANREKAISVMYQLLSSHPEQEHVLLKNIVNKLGDPCQKVVSKVIYCLTQLLRAHPNMKQVVLNEVEKLLFRPNIGTRAQYYCICLLSQFVFRNKDKEIARNIVTIYFAFFKASIKKGEVDTRLLGALLMGVKRSFPFADLEHGGGEVLSKHIGTLYKLVHVSTFNISLHTLCLLQQVSTTMEDRFYCALYKKLLDVKLANSTHHPMLINLLYKSLYKDDNVDRVKALIKRLFQICLHLPVPLVCGLLYMISQLVYKKQNLVALENKPQILLTAFEDDIEGEKYFDADKINDDLKEDVTAENDDKEEINENGGVGGWSYLTEVKPKVAGYNPYARNPSYAGIEDSAYFELINLSKHYHPSVSLFAHKILTKQIISYSGDPLSDFTLVRFLERFVFKNPKKLEEEAGSVKGPDPKLAMRKYYLARGAKAMSVTSSAYLLLEEQNVPVDELFLYKYLKEKYGEEGLDKRAVDDDDNDSVASDEFEELIHGLMPKSSKELNFLDDVGDSLQQSKKSGKKGGDDDDDDNDEDEDGEDDDEGEEDEEDMSGDEMSDVDDSEEDLDDISGGEDEAMDFSSDEGSFDGELNFDEAFTNKGKKSKKALPSMKPAKAKKKKTGIESLFAPAEEFAEILEEAGADSAKLGMSHTLSNRDNAAPKQINWELKRNQWVKGYGEKRKRKMPFKKGKKHKKF